jgi:hypothetical protein
LDVSYVCRVYVLHVHSRWGGLSSFKVSFVQYKQGIDSVILMK